FRRRARRAPMTATDVAQAPAAAGARRVARDLLGRSGTLSPLVGLVLLCILFTLLSPTFATPANASQILQQVMEVGTLAVGQTLIILVAGIDLANGAVMVLATIVMSKLATSAMPVAPAIGFGFLVTVGLGLFEGVVI